MKILSGFIVTMIAIGAAGADYLPTYVRGAPVFHPRVRAAASTPQCPNGKFGGICHDCSTMLFCVGKPDPLTTVTCKDNNPSSPYCVNNQCSAQKNDTDPTCDVGGKCTLNGYQPDPKDCTRYSYCSNGTSTLYECPQTYVYDHATNLCKKRTSPADCVIMNCTTPNTFVTYAPDKSIYAYCNDKLEQTVFQCEDAVNEWFDVTSVSCRIVCKEEGVFADRRDCTKYHQCFVVNGQWQIKHYACPPNLVFDKVQNKCISGNKCEPEITTATTPSGNSTQGGSQTTTPITSST